MARLIDADALSVRLLDATYYDSQDEDIVWQMVQDAPTIEAKPVVHGEWLDAPYVYFGAKRYLCSECKDSEFWEARFVIVKENFCPNCGADMRGET